MSESRMYTTQMDAARRGIVTPAMQAVAAEENMDVKELLELMGKGQVVIPMNRNHHCVSLAALAAG